MTGKPPQTYVVSLDDDGLEAARSTAKRREEARRGSFALLAAIRSYKVREARQ